MCHEKKRNRKKENSVFARANQTNPVCWILDRNRGTTGRRPFCHRAEVRLCLIMIKKRSEEGSQDRRRYRRKMLSTDESGSLFPATPPPPPTCDEGPALQFGLMGRWTTAKNKIIGPTGGKLRKHCWDKGGRGGRSRRFEEAFIRGLLPGGQKKKGRAQHSKKKFESCREAAIEYGRCHRD